MSLINKLEDHLRRGEGLIEVLRSEAEFKEVRSELLQSSLLQLRAEEIKSDRNIFKQFASRRLLNLKSIPEINLGPIFDINDMIQVVSSEEFGVGEVLGENRLFTELKAKFQTVSCEERSCGLVRVEIERLVGQIELSLYNIVFVGPLYSRDSDSEQEHQAMLWAFREARQRGARRFFIDSEIKSYPSFEIKHLEAEVLELGRPKIFIPLERSLTSLAEKGEIVKFFNDYVFEHQRVEKRILCSLFGKLDGLDLKVQKLLPLTGSHYCSQCNLILRGDTPIGGVEEFYLDGKIGARKTYSQKVFGKLMHRLKDVSVGELIERTEKEKDIYTLPEVWQMLGDAKFKSINLSEPYRDLDYPLKVLLQLALIRTTKVSGVVFLLELIEEDFVENRELIEEFLEALKNQGNSILLCMLKANEICTKKLTNKLSTIMGTSIAPVDFIFDTFCEFVSEEYLGSPLLVDLLNLRSKILEVYLATKQARLKGFSSLGDLSKKEFHCGNCKGLGYLKNQLPYGYQAVCACGECFGVGGRKDILQLTSYGISLEDCFKGSLKQLTEQFIAEPAFFSDKIQVDSFKEGLDFKINTLISELGLKYRRKIREICLISSS